MRYTLRYQIMLPMCLVLAVAMVGLSIVQATFAAQEARQSIIARLERVTTTLAESSFPVNDRVLEQMRGLSGAEFILIQGAKVQAASSAGAWDTLPRQAPQAGLSFASTVEIGEESYFHSALPSLNATPGQLHVLFPESAYRAAWWKAVWPPLAIGAGSLVTMAVLAGAIAARVTRPLIRLTEQASEIADGRFRQLPLPTRNDEARDLLLAINRMSGQLAESTARLKQTERLRTLAQLRGGLAHQLRNTATGARIALDLHRQECGPSSDESLDVCHRQLALLEKYLHKFLSTPAHKPAAHVPIDLTQVARDMLLLAEPAARHLRVHVQVDMPAGPVTVMGDQDGLEQVMLNLITNAIEAATKSPSVSPNTASICICLIELKDPRRCQLDVIDSGSGPTPEMAGCLFEPFATDKPDGTGLGLYVAQQVIEGMSGSLTWDRVKGGTRFRVVLPCGESSNKSHALTAQGKPAMPDKPDMPPLQSKLDKPETNAAPQAAAGQAGPFVKEGAPRG